MGYDLYGKNGYYFRNNVWWWMPLWDYVAKNCHDILKPADIENGFGNRGHQISASNARKIAQRLSELSDIGHTADYEKNYTDCIAGDAVNNKFNEVTMFYRILHSKYAKVSEGVYSIGEIKELSPEEAAEYSGKFSVENVRKFVEFCEKSGGFSIC